MTEYTKEELTLMFDALQDLYDDGMLDVEWTRLYRCTAWVASTQYMGMYIKVLKSYTTIVAVYIPETEKVYVRGFYSNTTCQHCAKFSIYIRIEFGRYLSGERLWKMGERVRVDKMK